MSDTRVQVYVPLPNAPIKGEYVWADPCGGNEFEVRNIPFFIYGINLDDVVRCSARSGDAQLVVQEVTRRSGNTTIRMVFEDDVSRSTIREILNHLTGLGSCYEVPQEGIVALSVHDRCANAVTDYLESMRKAGVLSFMPAIQTTEYSFDFGVTPTCVH